MLQSVKTVPETDRYQVSEERRLHFYAKGETIPIMAQGIWRVCQGMVQLSTLYANGEEGLLGWVGPSMCFSLWLTSLQTYQAKAISDVYLMWFSIREVENSAHLAQEMYPQLCRRLRHIEAMLAIAGQRRVEDRLHQLLFFLKQEMGQSVPEGTRVMLRLTHQDIANAINTSRVTVTRMLGKLRQEEAIAFDSGRHIILKHGHLLKATNSSILRHLESNINYGNQPVV